MFINQFWLVILKFVKMNTLNMCFSNMQALDCSFLPSFIVKFILVLNPITAEERESCIEPYTLIICSKKCILNCHQMMQFLNIRYLTWVSRLFLFLDFQQGSFIILSSL